MRLESDAVRQQNGVATVKITLGLTVAFIGLRNPSILYTKLAVRAVSAFAGMLYRHGSLAIIVFLIVHILGPGSKWGESALCSGWLPFR